MDFLLRFLFGAEQAIIADLLKAFGQHMLQEAVDEGEWRQFSELPFAGSGVLATEHDLLVVNGDDPAVGDGDAEERSDSCRRRGRSPHPGRGRHGRPLFRCGSVRCRAWPGAGWAGFSSVSFSVLRPIAAEDIRQFGHCRLEVGHELVDALRPGRLCPVGEMGIDRGGGGGRVVTEVFLDQAEIDTVLQEMGGIGMPRVWTEARLLIPASFFASLNAFSTHW